MASWLAKLLCCCWFGVYFIILLLLTSLILLALLLIFAVRDAPIASAVAAAVDSSAVDVNSAVGVIWVPAVVVSPACCPLLLFPCLLLALLQLLESLLFITSLLLVFPPCQFSLVLLWILLILLFLLLLRAWKPCSDLNSPAALHC